MSACIVTITGTTRLAKAVDRYLCCMMHPQVVSYFMTYDRSLLSGEMLEQADLFILELMRRDDAGFRAEALFVAESWLSMKQRVLIISGAAASGELGLDLYWDLSSPDTFAERVNKVLAGDPASLSDLEALKHAFQTYCRPAIDRHRAR